MSMADRDGKCCRPRYLTAMKSRSFVKRMR